MKRFLFLTVAALFVLRGLTFIAGCVSPSPSVTFPPYPPYPAYPSYADYPPYPGQEAGASANRPSTSGHKVGAFAPTPTSFSYTAGTSSGTVTVPLLTYVSGITACAGASSATVTMGVNGLTIQDGGSLTLDGAVQGPTITIPANGCWSLPNPIAGALYNLGPASTIVFGGTIATYFVAYQGFGGSP